jgi:TonB family protein
MMSPIAPRGGLSNLGGVGPGVAGAGTAGKLSPMPTPVSGTQTTVSGGVLNGKAISKPRPAYPPRAKAARASGTVTVQILVDESGQVVSAQAVSGHPLLRQAAAAAAQRARFSPTRISGQPVKVSGVVTYNFILPGDYPKDSAGRAARAAAARAESEELRRERAREKLHPTVAAVVERLRAGNAAPGAQEATFVRDGKAELRIRLSAKSPAVLAQLKRLGFETVLDPQSSSFIIGRLPLEKISALAELDAVLYVSPQR